MPQMAPMYWLILFIFFIFTLFMIMNIIFFNFNKKLLNKKNKIKMIKNYNKSI